MIGFQKYSNSVAKNLNEIEAVLDMHNSKVRILLVPLNSLIS